MSVKSIDKIEPLKPQELQDLGLDHLAYIKASAVFGEDQYFTIHAADGKKIAHYTNYTKAFNAVKSNNLHLITLH